MPSSPSTRWAAGATSPRKILDKKADYVLALKGNQGTLREDVEVFVAEQKANGFKDTKVSCHQTVDGDHGRIETRAYMAIHEVAWLQERHNWPGLRGVVMVESTREIGDKIEREIPFYITSLVLLAHALEPVIRGHCAVENSLHWVMDMIFRDDECRVRTNHAHASFTTLKHMAHNLMRKAPGKDSMRLKRKVAAWDGDFLASLVAKVRPLPDQFPYSHMFTHMCTWLRLWFGSREVFAGNGAGNDRIRTRKMSLQHNYLLN